MYSDAIGRLAPHAIALTVGLTLSGCTTPPAATPASSSDQAAAAQEGSPAGEVPVLRLDSINGSRPETAETGRNPFQFGVTRAPVTRGAPTLDPEPVEDRPAAAFPPPSESAPVTPEMPLKFIGIVEARESAGLVAVLSDGEGVYHGRQDEVIEGRYRIVRIGIESIEIEVLDGGRRETIRLSGSQ
jgi:hypothetical protein